MSQQNHKLFMRITGNSYRSLSKLIKPSMSLDSGIGSLGMSPGCSDEYVVRRLFVFIKDNLIFESLQDGLIHKKLLNEKEKEEYVCSNCARHYWSERLLKLIIKKKRCKEFVAFIRQMACHKHVSEKIMEVQEKAKGGTLKAANGAVQRRLNLTLTHELLQRHFACLYMALEPQEIADEMFQAGHLTVFDHDTVTESNQRYKRLSFLLNILMKKELYAQLVCTLQSLGYRSVLDTLQKDRKLKNKPSEYSTCIQHNFILLQENIPCFGDARFLMEHELDPTNISDIESCKSAVRKISKLLKILLIRGKPACKEFFRVMEVDLKREDLIQKMKYKSEEIKQRGRPDLNQRHRSLKTQCLQEHEEFLNEELEPLDVCDLLFEERAIEISAHDKITETSRRQKQMKYLLETVKENKNDCFLFFLYILQKEGHESILEELKKSAPRAVGAVSHEQSENLRLSLRVAREPDDVGNGNINMRLSVGGRTGPQVEQVLQDSHSSGTEILEEAILHGVVDIRGVSSGSILLQLRPVTDQAVQTLLNVRDNNRLVEMIVGMLKKVNIASMMDGTEPLEIKVQVYKANPVGVISKVEDAEPIKKRLKAHRNVLVSELEPRAIAHVLSKSKAFAKSAIDSVLNADSCNDRVENLLSLVEDGDFEVVKEFVTALKDLGYSSIVELIDPPDIHNRAENIRKVITSNYKNILEEMQMKLAKETLSKCVGDVDEIREKILPKNGDRKKRMSSFLQFILQDDHNVIEFEKMLRNNDLEDLLKIDENVQGEHIPTQGIEMTFVEDRIHSSSEGVLFEAVITLSHTEKSDRKIQQKVGKVSEETGGQQGETGAKQLDIDFEKMHLDESPPRPQRLDMTPTSPDIPLKGNESMAEKLKYHAFKRNTLLEELQTILHEYPDNEQIIKELLQNAEDAGARVVKMGFCPSSRSQHLPDPYKKYLSGPAFCFYNDSVFQEKDWEGITMVRKSNKHDDPLKVGKFGIGFKSVFHITDTVVVISGTSILFIDPLYEEIDPRKVCCQVSISDFVQQDVCGPQALESLYRLFGINEDTIRGGNFAGTVFWFPLRNSPSNLSENVYTPKKVSDLLASFKKEIGTEMLFLTSIEEIGLFNMVNSSWETDTVVSLDNNCAKGIRKERERYKTEIKAIEDHMESDERWITSNFCNPVWMKCNVAYNVETDGETSRQEWLVINYFHAGTMSAEISNLIRNRRSKYRPYIGIAARLDQPIACGQLFCFLPLPFEEESSTGLPVHVNGFFSLDSNRQHIKWPSYDQTSSKSHLENDMLWNVCMVQEILPIVYKELFEFWRNNPKLGQMDLRIFYHCIPRKKDIKHHWDCVEKEINEYMLESRVPCIEKRAWVNMKDAYFAIFEEDIKQDVRDSVIDVFSKCGKKVVILGEHEDLFKQWNSLANLSCTSPMETRNLLKIRNEYKGLQRSCKEHLLLYCCSDDKLSQLGGIELLPLQNKKYHTFQEKQRGKQDNIYLCEKEDLEILIGKEGSLVLKDSTELGHLLQKLATSGYYAFQKLFPTIWIKFLCEISKKTEMKTEKPKLLRQSSAIYGDNWLAKVWRYLANLHQISLDPVQELFLIKTKESDNLKKVSDVFFCETDIDDCNLKTLAYFKIWVVDTTFHDNYLLKPGRGIVQEFTNEGKRKVLERCITNGLLLFNNQSTDTEKEWFKIFLPDTTPKSLISSLQKLNIFKCFSSVHPVCSGYTSLDQCDKVYIGNRDFPIQFPTKMIMSTNRLEERLLLELNASYVDLTECVQNLLKENSKQLLKATDEVKRRFCFYVLGKKLELRNWEKIQTHLNEVKFIKNGTEQLYSAKELYDPNDCVLKELFLGESKFPEERTEEMALLCNVEFQNGQSSEFMLDIVRTCQKFEKISSDLKERKSDALLQILRQNPKIVESLCKKIGRFKVVPFKEEKNSNYPKSMNWYAQPEKFVSFEMMYSSQYIFIIGSVLPTPKKEWEEFIDRSKQPALSDVIRHFHKVVMCYNEEEHTGYSFMMEKVYRYLAGKIQSIVVKLPTNCVFTEKGFLPASKIYIEHKKSDLDLKPYFIPLPKEYVALKTLFEKFDCKKSQSSELLVQCLIEIEKSHQEKNTESDSIEDIIKVEQILKKLSELSKEELVGIQNRIKVPIQTMDSDKLEFRFAQECAYSDSDWFSKTFTEEDNVCLIHSKIGKEIAEKIGVKSLKKFTISDAEEICSEFGQSEPLTQRLNRLLEEGYTDGLSVPKELIQNADDAGATEVYFLYDERENGDAKCCLLDAKMEDCQGPALWAFNNAVFTSSDFENIQKLSGATKKQDTTKIGKFGLGFNAVYNITDIPSFVSGTHLVYLDPHGKYLGDAIVNKKSPGIKLNLKNGVMLRKFVNQFKPYQNVFGFRSSVISENGMYKGTLFRFPLRTKSQSRTSEISSKEYSPKEMEKLMKQFCKTSGNMILFTQNVKQIKIFHVDKGCVNPDREMKLVLTIKKEEYCGQTSKKWEHNILRAASNHCSSGMYAPKFLETFNTKITLSSEGHSWIDQTSQFREETNWVVTWALGYKKSLRLFKERESDGALPLSSVGIPVDIDNGNFSPVFLGIRKPVLKKFGFYDIGHLFCFLPLPIKSPLAFHVNGTFAVSSDRQRLLTRTEDDKDNTKQSVWNDSLLSDATLEAILGLLIVINNSAADSYLGYELWPTMGEDISWKALQDEFFKAVVERCLPVFKTHDGYKPFEQCLFLHLEISSDEHLKKIAFNLLKENPLDGKIITDIPGDIYQRLEACHGKSFLKHVVSYEKFITKSFLPNIVKFSGKEYDKIVLGALRSKNKNILIALKDCNCIATCTDLRRKSPKDLVHPCSLVSGIFSTEDERFPSKLFCNEKDLDVLVSLGMMKNEIQFDLLKTQTINVRKLATRCTECAFLRSKNIVHYVKQRVPKELKNELSNIPFLPVKEKPDNWPPLKWAIDTSAHINMKCSHHKDIKSSVGGFERPCNLYFPSLRNLVGCSKPLLGRYEDYSIDRYELQLLGLNKEKDIDVKTLQCQVMELTKNPENAQIKEIEEMCRELYRAISERLTEPDVEDFVCNQLSKLPCVITEKTFVYPRQVIFSLMHDCSPFLYGLRPWCVGRLTSLMEKCGVRKCFESCDIIDALLRIKNQQDGEKLSKNALGLVSRITNLLEDCQFIPVENLFLPDTNGFFCHVNDLCIDDFDWIFTTESMKFLNTTISLKVAKMVGIKSKRDQSILNESEDFGDEFGQHEELTNRIKRILDGYPEASILKELLQNADDAGATELHFIKDFRSHGTEHIFSDNWKELQGPALCVYNDSVFTDKDLLGIQNIGIGSKGDDPTSTGQYGVGFNVVYHLTDVPSFLTRDVKNDVDTLCVLDPHKQYIPYASSKKPGRKFLNGSEMLGGKFKDILPCYLLKSGIWDSSRGTLFRFPLRCKADSLLSNRITSCDELNHLLNVLKNEIAECLIFLHNVRKVTISSVKEDGSCRVEYIVTSEMSNNSHEENLHSYICSVRELMKIDSSYACRVERKEMKYILSVNINNELSQEWLIVTGFGFVEKALISPKIQNAYANKQLALLPTSGVAFNLKNKRIIQSPDGKKYATEKLGKLRAYCFLPLPLHTGLPVHVNGHFALDHEARRNVWWPDEESQDLKVCWNKCLIENVIVPTYISVLQYLKTTLFSNSISKKPWNQLDKYHNAFPCMKNISDKIWQHLGKTLYIKVAETHRCVFPIVRREYEKLEMGSEEVQDTDVQRTQGIGTANPILKEKNLEIKWVSLFSGGFPAYFDEIKYQLRDDIKQQGYYGTYGQTSFEVMKWATNKSEFLSGVLKDLGMKIIESPLWIFNSLNDAGTNVQTVSPKEVLMFLKSYNSKEVDKCNIERVPTHVSKTRFQRIDGVYYILEYCLRDRKLNHEDFRNVPLLLSEAEIVNEFEQNSQIFLTSVKHLLPFSANNIVHFSLYNMLRGLSILQVFIENLQIEDFSKFVIDNVPEKFRRGTIESWDMDSPSLPNGIWIKRFWLYLAENVSLLENELNKKMLSKKEKKQKASEHPVEQLCYSVIRNLGDCSFLPVSVQDTSRLFPLKEGKHVLKILPKSDCPDQLALMQLDVPLLDDKALYTTKGKSTLSGYNIEILKYLVATVENVLDTLDCVYFNRTHLNREKSACAQILDYFVRHIDILKKNPNCRMKLRCLPFYCGLVDGLITLSETDIVVLPGEIPGDGLHELGLKRGIQFIRQSGVPTQFFEYLGCISRTATELYIYYILPHFGLLPASAVLHHLKFLKDIIIPHLNYYPSKDDEMNLTLLRGLLRDIPFIPVELGQLACASDFFNPHKEIFKVENQLCSQAELPPPPYDKKEWEEFLVHCGMKSDMTLDIFADFANRLETLANKEGITSIVQENSKRMVNILFNDLDLNNSFLLQKIRSAKFLTPHDSHYLLLTLAPKFRRKGQLLCFSEATLPSNDSLVWTVMGTVSEDITNIMSKANVLSAVKNFGFLEVPSLSTVLNHTTIVCNAVAKNIKRLCAENDEVERVVTRTMTQIYTFWQKNQSNESVYWLKDIPFVFIKERVIFVTAEHVVLDINKHEEIPPYLCKAPLYFGQFHTLFERQGAAKSLSCNHLAHVLFEIWTKSKGANLEPNEMFSTKKAVQILFSKLKTENAVVLNVSVLYLPSKKHTLIKSSELVFIDDKLLESRIGNNMPEMDYFVGFKELCMEFYDPVSEISRLPEIHRPRLLSKVVIEQLDSECKKCTVPSSYAKKLQTFLHCLEFLAGVCRLVRDEQYKNDSVCGEEVELDIQKKLLSVEVKCLEQLKTVMTYKSTVLLNTSKKKSIFSATETDEIGEPKLCIYFAETGNSDDTSWIKMFTKQVSISLNVYLGKPLKENHIHLPDVLKCINEPSSIESELDNLDICSIDTKTLSKLLPFMPELGSEIPIVLHHLLDNSCTYIDPGEYVAYELFDPIIDEDDACETEPVYILAKVLETNASRNENPNADEWTISYLLDIGSDQPIEVVASKVYKFIRSNTDDTNMDVVDCAVVFSWNFDRVKCYIRDVLKNAFARGDQEFRRTLKRLLLQYHPDKHLDNKDYFNELTLFIYFVKKRLENGESVDDAAIFNFNKREEFPRSHFTENVYQRGTRQGRHQRSYRQSDDYFSQFFSRGSQPGQARRWYRQAEFDFQASTSDKHQPGAYNWACYKSHQSAEKALKALQYQLDADQVIQTHRLPALTSCLNDSELSMLAIRLEGITGNYFQMRYPDAVPSGDGMRIPSDLYNAAKAKDAIELAGEILQRVRSKIPNL
nr:sacsin-like isoform X8 [Crassostrea gigas]